ncbi:C1 family peptidase [Chryseosolibacter indicus]|uniref:Aminopeptidase n=1 Tax=Chryseosolibacter indicus TaxID=2782351 RepID=A0ABS5VQJ5_9BACT|nr:C1 family peptidase [Chryseosolibacter indicus]MBT1703421.1 aminopeptidase [Chryseosolibacter indicus]
MLKITVSILVVVSCSQAFAQGTATHPTPAKTVAFTPVKNQANTGTCWSFSTISLIESQTIKSGLGEFDLSEMYTVRSIYTEKARNYILRQGAAQFGPGGLGHDVINAISKYGTAPESVYSGLLLGTKSHDHSKLDASLKAYLDNVLSKRPIASDWMTGFQQILDDHLGKAPEKFTYKEKVYTPISFAKEVLKFNSNDYVFLTSFSHHPYYDQFILEIPDNYANASYHNLPLEEMIALVDKALEKGFSLMWDADVSNANFNQKKGYALQLKEGKDAVNKIDPEAEEDLYNQGLRQQLFENLTTQDDHLMHLVGVEKSTKGKKFYVVKNSWGEVGPFKGLIKVSEAYFAINTVSLVVPKDALDDSLKGKMRL